MDIWSEISEGNLILWGRLRDEIIWIGRLDVWEKLLPLLKYFSPGGPTGITAKSDGFTITFQRPNPVYGKGTQCLSMPVESAFSRNLEGITALVMEKTALATAESRIEA